MWRSGDTDEPSSARRSLFTAAAVLVTFGLVTALLLGSWTLLKPAPGSSDSSGSAPSAATEPTRSVSVARRQDPGDLSAAEAQARQENLDLLAGQRKAFESAIRAAVGPKMTQEDLDQLALEVHLLCVSSSPAKAETSLIQRGMTAATAKAVIKVSCA
jgi:hypothetical protein